MSDVTDSISKGAKRLTSTALGTIGKIAPIYDPFIMGPQVKKLTDIGQKELSPGEIAQPEIAPTPPTVMPVPGQDDLANIAARRRSVQAQLLRRGRLSTILSQPQNEPLGG